MDYDDEPMPSVEDFETYTKNQMIATLESAGISYENVADFVGKSANNWRGVTKGDCIVYFSHHYGAQAAAPASPYAGWAPPSPSAPPSPNDDIRDAILASNIGAQEAVSSEGKQQAPVSNVPDKASLKKMTIANLKKLASENNIPEPSDGWGRKAEIVDYIDSMRGAAGAPVPSAPPMVNAEDLYSMGRADWNDGSGNISGDANGVIPGPEAEIHIEQNDNTSTELSRFYNMHDGDYLEPAWQSIRTGLAQSLNMFLDEERAQQSRFAREARKSATTFNQGGTDFLRTELYSFLLLSGRRRRDGVSVQNIHPGRGPIISTDRGWPTDHTIRTPHGFTTFIVNRTDFTQEQHQGFVLSPDLSNTLSPSGSAAARTFLRENYHEILLGAESGSVTTLRIVQLPMSVEIAGDGSAPVPICNILFFMNPTEMERLLHDGIFHQLEYYANAYDNPSLKQAYETLVQSEGGNVSVLRKISLFSRALADWFTGTYGFSSEARSANGQPDALYIYKQWVHHVRIVQKQYNDFVTLLNKLKTTPNPSQSLKNLVDESYKILVNVIYEMDVWNYIVQTPLPGSDPASPGHWNFSALGISRVPNIGETQAVEGNNSTLQQLFSGNTFTLNARLASYKLSTKAPIEYPRWMLQIFTTIEEYLLTTGVSVEESMAALNAATDRLQSQRLTIPESIAFGNLTALYRRHQPGSQGIPNTPEERLRLLFPTRAGPNLTVEQAHRATEAADARLLVFIREAASMTDEQYLAETGQPRAAVRLARQPIRSTNPNSITQYFQPNDILELPDNEFRDIAETDVSSNAKKRRVTLSSNVGNRQIKIIRMERSFGTGDIFYDYEERQGGGVSRGRISQLDLLLSQKNVDIAKSRQTDRSIQQQMLSAQRQGQSERQAACAVENIQRTSYTQLFDDNDRYERHLLALAQSQAQSQASAITNPAQATIITTETATSNQKADGVILMMSREMRARQSEMMRQQRILRAAAQNDALVGQQAVESASLSEYNKKVIYFEYKMYREKWRSLKTQWYAMYRLLDVDDPKRPKVDSNKNKLPLREWIGQTSGKNITIVRNRLMTTIFDRTIGCLSGGIFRSLIQRARRALTESTEPLDQTWNNGRLRSFEEWRRNTYPQTGMIPYDQLNQEWYNEQEAREAQYRTWIKEDQAEIAAAQSVIVPPIPASELSNSSSSSSSVPSETKSDSSMFGGAKVEDEFKNEIDMEEIYEKNPQSVFISRYNISDSNTSNDTTPESKTGATGGKKKRKKKTRRRRRKKNKSKKRGGAKKRKKTKRKYKHTKKR